MRFKTFYLQEKLIQRSINDLKNIISGIAEKEIPNEEKVERGIQFKISNLGAWSGFKNKLVEILTEKKWKDYSKKPNVLNFKNKDQSLFVEYKNGNVEFFLTDDLEFIPGEEDNETK